MVGYLGKWPENVSYQTVIISSDVLTVLVI